MSPVTVGRPNLASGSASGMGPTTGIVLSVSGNVAKVKLRQAEKIQDIRTDIMPAKGIAPKPGEIWLVDQRLGARWYFAAILQYPGLDAIEWHDPVLLGNWDNADTGTWTPGNGNFAPVGFARDDLGWVTLRGTATGGSAANSNAPGPVGADIFQLPDGYRPAADGQLRFAVAAGTGIGSVMVRPDGFVRAITGSGAVSLDGVRFLAVEAADYNVHFEPLVTLITTGEQVA